MAPIAERFVRVRLDTKTFPAELKQFLRGEQFTKAGTEAGREFARSFKATVKAELAAAKFKVKVEADYSGFKNLPGVPRVKAPASGDQSAPSRAPKVPVQLDPLLEAFQAQVRREVATLARRVAVQVPVTADTQRLRDDLGARLRELQDKAKVKVDAQAPDRAKFEADLRAMLRDVQSRVKIATPQLVGPAQKVPVELDPLMSRFQADVRRELSGLTRTALRIPVNPETAGLRREVALRIAAIERTLKIKVPVDAPDGQRIRTDLENSLGGLKQLLGGALGLAPQALQTLSGGFDAVTGSSTKAASSTAQLGSSLSGLAGPIGTASLVGLVAVAISALPAVALAATGAIFALGGALASLPALGVGLGASIGALGLGFSGISDHLKTLPKTGGGAAKSLSAVNSATRGLANAQRDLLKATNDINKARADEVKRIRDLNLNLRESTHAEADAVAAVAEARTALAAARATGDPNEIGKAQRAFDDATDSLEEARNKTSDLREEKAKSDRDGVEGSDQVQAALERQRDAIDRVTAAQEALADAQRSQAGAAAAALAKLKPLAPAAQEVVDKIKALKPAFADLRLSVQQQLFAGVGDELQKLADVWLPQLKTTLGSYAAEFNGLFKNLSESVRKPEFVSNIASAAETLRGFIDKIGRALTGPFVDAFGRLARAAKPFIDVLGDKLAGLVNHFSKWIEDADKSGKLTKFFQDAAYYFGVLWDIGGNVVGIFGDILKLIFDTPNQGGAKDYLSGLNEQLAHFREWLADPENQQKIKDIIENFGKFVAGAEKITIWITDKALPLLGSFIDVVHDVIDAVEWLKNRFAAAKDNLVEVGRLLVIGLTAPFSWIIQRGNDIVGTLNGIRGRLNLTGMFDGLYYAAYNALNNVINLFNRLHLGLSFSVNPSSATITGSARKLAAGGIARATPGGIQATIAEGGKDEVVSPVEQMQDYIRTAVAEANAASPGGHAGDIIIPVYIGTELVDTIVVSAAQRQKTAIAKAVNSGNKNLGYAS